MRPKFASYNPKRDDKHFRHLYTGVPPPGIMSLFCSIWFRTFEAGVQAGACAGATVKVHEEIGNLELGKIHKVYVQDPGLRDILKLIELDSDKVKDIQGHKLRLITSVVYSERLKLRGKRFTEVMKNRSLFTCLSNTTLYCSMAAATRLRPKCQNNLSAKNI